MCFTEELGDFQNLPQLIRVMSYIFEIKISFVSAPIYKMSFYAFFLFWRLFCFLSWASAFLQVSSGYNSDKKTIASEIEFGKFFSARNRLVKEIFEENCNGKYKGLLKLCLRFEAKK